MQFTKSELNIMDILWNAQDGLAPREIKSNPKKSNTWQTQTFNVIMKGLIEKGTVEIVPNWKNNNRGRLYKAKMTIEEYYGQLLAEHERSIIFGSLSEAYLQAKAAREKGDT